MEEYQWVAELTDLAPDTMKGVRASGVALLLVNVEGEVYALGDSCTHSKCYLHIGKLKGQVVTCPCHFAEFDVTTGAVLAPPAKTPLTMYPVKVEGTGILVAV